MFKIILIFTYPIWPLTGNKELCYDSNLYDNKKCGLIVTLIMKKRIILLLIATLYISAALTGCRHKTGAWNSMNEAERLIQTHPDSSLSILSAIDRHTLGDDEEKARYALLMSMALDKNYVDTTTFEILQPAIDYYLKKGTPDEKLRTLYYQGRIYQNGKNDDMAMRSFIQGREYIETATDTLTAANLLVAQGVIYYSTYKIDDFIENNEKAARLYNSINRPDYEFSSLAKIINGSIQIGNKQLADSVLNISKGKILHHPEYGAEILPHVLSYAIAWESKEHLRRILDSYSNLDSIEPELKLNVALGFCKIGEPAKAISFLHSAETDNGIRESLKYLAVKSQVLEENGDLAGALKAYRSFYKKLEAQHQKIFSQDLLFAQQKHEMEISSLTDLRKRDNFIWIISCGVLLLLFTVIYIFYRYRLIKTKNLLSEKEKERLQLQLDNLQKEKEKVELERKNAKLECERQMLAAENMRLKIKQLEEESISLKSLLMTQNDIAKPVEDAIKVRIEMLNGLLATCISENSSYAQPYGAWRDKLVQDKDEFMNSTRLAFKASHPKFIEYLEQHRLSEAEINYLCLYAIGLRGKEVGEYIQLRRHYHISSDIRRKLGIDDHETNIGIYIRKLMKIL